MSRVVYVSGDDWVGLYVDGVLFAEGHSLHPRDVAAACGVELEQLSCDCDWLYEAGSLPDGLSDVKLEERA